MGKFTDDFFTFPIKVYDGFSLKKAMEQEDKENVEGPVPIDWVAGWVKIPARDLSKMMWHEGFSRERDVKEVAEEGFDLTIVISEVWGEFVCTWARKKFEAKLDEFMEKRQSSFSPYIATLPIDDLAKVVGKPISPQGDGKKDG